MLYSGQTIANADEKLTGISHYSMNSRAKNIHIDIIIYAVLVETDQQIEAG
jgi:hypothetical protein